MARVFLMVFLVFYLDFLRKKEKELYINDINNLKKVFENEEERKDLFDSIINNSDIFQKTFFYIYNRKNKPRKRLLKVKNLHVNLSYLMKDGELYTSPLTFKSFEQYSKISYNIYLYKDERETKISEGHGSN